MVGGGTGRGQGQTVWSFCSRDTHSGAASMSEQDLPVLRLHASHPEAVFAVTLFSGITSRWAERSLGAPLRQGPVGLCCSTLSMWRRNTDKSSHFRKCTFRVHVL